MKRTIAAALLALSVFALVPTEASAWYCRAAGDTGARTWGSSVSLYRAKRLALAECSVRTPRGYMCYIRSCY